MKTKLSFLALLLSVFAFAQIPSGYYNTATGSGYTLKTQLYNVIKGHTDQGYGGLWTTYSTSDRDKEYENDNSIIDIYSENPTGVDPYHYNYGTNQCGTYSTEGNCYNREHIIPQSIFNSASPMVADAHFITPTDGKVNSQRSNYPHGNVSSPSWTSLNGSKLGTSAVSGYTGTVFEPINEFKGDVARMYFYFATRYENTVSEYSYSMFNGTSNQVFTTAFLNLLKTWHTNDPVSPREIARNNAIYARQGNRNPYIDHPEYVNIIWGGTINTGGDITAPTTPSNLSAGIKTTTSIALSWTASTDNIGVTGYNIYMNGVLKASATTTSTTITGLTATTTYSFTIKAKDAAGNTSSNSTAISATTNTVSTSLSIELFFTEYLEGSSNNKALEITNKTSGSINLSSYSIKRQTNGSGSWSSGISLLGTLTSGSKFVIVNNFISSSCYSSGSANLSTNAIEMTFNGNDAIGLFKNGVLIDIIGIFNGGSVNFAADETLRRKTTVTAPSTTFKKATQWDSFTTDTCTGIGNRLNGNSLGDIDFNVYPNPSEGYFNIDFQNPKENYNVEIYSLLGQKVFEKETNTSLLVANMQSGIYLIKITKDNKMVTKKMVIK
jgi:endonuclease I